MNFLGIDPGTSGAWAVVDDNGRAAFDAAPTTKIKVGKHQRTRIDLPAMAQALADIDPLPTLAAIELVGPMPRDGRVGSFAFGASYGMVQGLCAGLDIPVALVRPQDWQGALLGQGMAGTTKARSIAYCLAQWPGIDLRATPRAKKAHDGIADALCLAAMAMRIWLANREVDVWG